MLERSAGEATFLFFLFFNTHRISAKRGMDYSRLLGPVGWSTRSPFGPWGHVVVFD